MQQEVPAPPVAGAAAPAAEAVGFQAIIQQYQDRLFPRPVAPPAPIIV